MSRAGAGPPLPAPPDDAASLCTTENIGVSHQESRPPRPRLPGSWKRLSVGGYEGGRGGVHLQEALGGNGTGPPRVLIPRAFIMLGCAQPTSDGGEYPRDLRATRSAPGRSTAV